MSIWPFTRALEEDVCRAAGVEFQEGGRAAEEHDLEQVDSDVVPIGEESSSEESSVNEDSSDGDYEPDNNELDILGFAPY